MDKKNENETVDDDFKNAPDEQGPLVNEEEFPEPVDSGTPEADDTEEEDSKL
jgi:hypothetical protein